MSSRGSISNSRGSMLAIVVVGSKNIISMMETCRKQEDMLGLEPTLPAALEVSIAGEDEILTDQRHEIFRSSGTLTPGSKTGPAHCEFQKMGGNRKGLINFVPQIWSRFAVTRSDFGRMTCTAIQQSVGRLSAFRGSGLRYLDQGSTNRFKCITATRPDLPTADTRPPARPLPQDM